MALPALAAFVYWNNAAWLAPERPAGAMLLAHRGLAQTFDDRWAFRWLATLGEDC